MVSLHDDRAQSGHLQMTLQTVETQVTTSAEALE